MTKIRMKTTAASSNGTYEKGKEYPLNKTTEKYVKAGYAEYTEKPEEKMQSNRETPESKKETNVYPKETGGGWYELSSGKKIQGREEAIKVEKELG